MANLQPTLDKRSVTSERAQQLDAVVWAALFIWIGIGMLAAVPWGWSLVGIGVLIGAAQFARWQIGTTVDSFWVACGAVILAAGLWDVLRLPWPLAPVLLIALGLWLLAKTVMGTSRNA
jgi:hypothetical protein